MKESYANMDSRSRNSESEELVDVEDEPKRMKTILSF